MRIGIGLSARMFGGSARRPSTLPPCQRFDAVSASSTRKSAAQTRSVDASAPTSAANDSSDAPAGAVSVPIYSCEQMQRFLGPDSGPFPPAVANRLLLSAVTVAIA